MADPITIDARRDQIPVMFNEFNSGNTQTAPTRLLAGLAPPTSGPAWDAYHEDMADYAEAVAEAKRVAYADAIRDRLKLVSGIRPGPPTIFATKSAKPSTAA